MADLELYVNPNPIDCSSELEDEDITLENLWPLVVQTKEAMDNLALHEFSREKDSDIDMDVVEDILSNPIDKESILLSEARFISQKFVGCQSPQQALQEHESLARLSIHTADLLVTVFHHMRGRWQSTPSDTELMKTIARILKLALLINGAVGPSFQKLSQAGGLKKSTYIEAVKMIRIEHQKFLILTISSAFPPNIQHRFGFMTDNMLSSIMRSDGGRLPVLIHDIRIILAIPTLTNAAYVVKHAVQIGTLSWSDLKDLRGENAVRMLDVLQLIVDHFQHAPCVPQRCSGLILRLQKVSHMVPNILFVDPPELLSHQPLTSGGFGDIYQGKVPETGKIVALKVSRFFSSMTAQEVIKMQKSFYSEAVVWRQMKHQNITPFYGINKDLFESCLCMISPWMANGNIMVYLRDNPGNEHQQLLYEAACGLEYLHKFNPPLLHGDLKGANILVDDERHACLCDFGLSRFVEMHTRSQSRGLAGSIRWKAPESLYPGDINETEEIETSSLATDIYSFGMTMLEVYSGQAPFTEINSDTGVIFAVVAEERPKRPSPPNIELSDDVWELITACWSHEPSGRPNASAVREKLSYGRHFFCS